MQVVVFEGPFVAMEDDYVQLMSGERQVRRTNVLQSHAMLLFLPSLLYRLLI